MDHLAILRDELAVFQRCLEGDLSAPVEHCGDWTLRDLAEHLGQENLWAATAVRERRGNYEPQPTPADIGPWFASTAAELTEALTADPSAPAWTFAPPRTVGFWRRRRCLETLVHRWDAQHALGIAEPLDPALCADGVAEVLDMFVPRQINLGRMAPMAAAVRLTATDTGTSWTLGPGEPVAAVSGTAEDLLLILWNRRPVPDAAARELLRGPLVP
ncbi:maleylpyruvate isomerase family mycothiol-dependent enzyme [Actinoplanes sp. LDG1-06]|uniref:Maleylpyruvate isomerase family mycothiol-dependent enzyme n=1 Tax=Paractinoplanes ovalisporus TaxID=2810368 RepID=A0ABS2AMT5_9ACTN|nr:maleylpyruvate isomerase family mycothiol-dependent enzyme [Actinoplanes ovalisporus]MBM2620541.1 maleylpyruvate isomerase family mycothiol-dependent enzyme [Actinoplanes ovalisporus]